jgi:hypothetical protein
VARLSVLCLSLVSMVDYALLCSAVLCLCYVMLSLVVVLVFACVLAYVSNCSLVVEGKTFRILKLK